MRNFIRKFSAFLCAASVIAFSSCGEKKESGDIKDPAPESGQFVTNPDEPELGEYTVSANGTKLYYSPDEFSSDIMAVLEKYFIAFSQGDYESYAECVYPEYITEMNEFLEADYGYDLSESFSNQCESLKDNAGGEYTVTRIKAELPEEDGAEDYLTQLGEIFETDFYNNVKNDCDALHDMIFYVMVEADGEETLLLSEFEIVFAEKDGKFYTFG